MLYWPKPAYYFFLYDPPIAGNSPSSYNEAVVEKTRKSDQSLYVNVKTVPHIRPHSLPCIIIHFSLLFKSVDII